MQALLILSLIVFYLLDQLVGGQIVQGAWWRAAAVPLVMLIGPVAIALQAFRTTRAAYAQPQNHHRLQQITIGFWFVSGLLLVAGVNWGSILRHQLHLAAWAPLDEIILFAPLFLSLLLCWAAQFHVEQRWSGGSGFAADTTAKLRREFIAIRAHVFLVPAIAPVGALVASQVLGNWLARMTGSVAAATWLNLGFLLVFLALLPRLIAAVWGARRLPDGPVRNAITTSLQVQRVRFRDIRVWPTGNQLTNAMVVGLLPKLRILILTDRLLRLLSVEELCVVVAHEAGHVRRRHLPVRIWFVLLPLVALSIVPFVLRDVLAEPFGPILLLGLRFDPLMGVIIGATYSVYAYWMMAWISRKMEFQADLFACQARGAGGKCELNVAAANNFCESLIKIAADSGEDVRRSGWLHPSVQSRVQFLLNANSCPELSRKFERSFARQKLWLTLTIFGLAVAVSLF